MKAVIIVLAMSLSGLVYATGDGKTIAEQHAARKGKLFPPVHEVGTRAGPVTERMLLDSGKSGNWIMTNGGYNNFRHSTSKSLNPDSARTLKLAWAFPTPAQGTYAGAPVIYGGVMYVTGAYNHLLALDAATGKLLWRYAHALPTDALYCCGPANRGVAIKGDLLYMGTLDAKLIAFNRNNGRVVWSRAVDDNYQQGYSITSAPLVVGNTIYTGVGGGEYGIRGFISAFTADTGKELWKFYTLPVAGDAVAATWEGNSYASGGGPTWTTGTYDPETDTLFWTTGNPSPDWNGDDREGDNLYTDSLLALDPHDGRLKWYFQFTPHNVWDYDGNGHFFLIDTTIDGKKIKAFVQANRNGFFYILDRSNGKFIRATKYAEVNWAERIDANGRPVVNPAKMPRTENPERTCPGGLGGTNGAVSASYSPVTGLAYIPVTESCWKFAKYGTDVLVSGMKLAGFPEPVDIIEGKDHGHLSAIDVTTGNIVWEYRDPEPMMAGTLNTAGGVVITGNHSGDALAFDASTGVELWRFNMGTTVRAQPVAYEIEGRPYVVMGTGSAPLIDSLSGGRQDLPPGGYIFVFTTDK